MEFSPKRKQRIPAHAKVRINNLYSAEALDISEDGMYIYSRHTFLPDSLIELDVIVGGDTTKLSAKVAHVQPGVGFGVTFPDVPDEVAELFRDILKSALLEDEGD